MDRKNILNLLNSKKIYISLGILSLFAGLIFLSNPSGGFENLSSRAVSQPAYSGTWQAGSWKICSNPCTEKTETRAISCIKNGRTVPVSNCDPKKKPSNSRACSNKCTNLSCAGNIPANASLCSGDDTALTLNSTRTLVSACTTAKKCEYTCATNFTLQGATCVPKCRVKTDGDLNIAFYASGFNTRLDSATRITFITNNTSVTGSYEIGGEKFVCDTGTMSQPFYPENMYVSEEDKKPHTIVTCENGHSLQETITTTGVILEITQC